MKLWLLLQFDSCRRYCNNYNCQYLKKTLYILIIWLLLGDSFLAIITFKAKKSLFLWFDSCQKFYILLSVKGKFYKQLGSVGKYLFFRFYSLAEYLSKYTYMNKIMVFILWQLSEIILILKTSKKDVKNIVIIFECEDVKSYFIYNLTALRNIVIGYYICQNMTK